MEEIQNKEDWAWYIQKLDADAKYKHRHEGVPEKFPCKVRSDFFDDPNGPYTYTHTFIYQKKEVCEKCGHAVLVWDV